MCYVGVLEETPDVLVNVNIIEVEKAAQNVELRKKKTGYNPYGEEEVEVCVRTYVYVQYAYRKIHMYLCDGLCHVSVKKCVSSKNIRTYQTVSRPCTHVGI